MSQNSEETFYDGSTDIGGNAASRLAAFVERIENLEDEIKGAKEDQKEVYSEAKGVGFDTKILRKVIKRRKMDREKVMEEDAILECYETALDQLTMMME